MKKVLLSLLVMGTGILSAQVISFEQSEGFFPGDINAQQEGWAVTGDGAGGFITGQNIVDTMASDGTQSFMNAEVPEYGPQESYIIGVFADLEPSIPFEDGFTVSYDFYGTEWDGSATSDFSFNLADITETGGSYVVRIFFSYDGSVFMVGADAMGTVVVLPTTGTWTVNTWHNAKLEYVGGVMNLYLDNELISTGLPMTVSANINDMRILHDNYGGDGYYDNIRINDTAGVNDQLLSRGVSTVFPNPAKDVVKIKLAEEFNEAKTSVTVTSVTGQNVATFTNVNDMNVSKLPAGVYVMTITDGVNTETKKFIKK